MIKMLSIGNSFSCDALAYFGKMAEEAGTEVEVWHMEIGGCSFERHYNNMKGDICAYNFLVNGEPKPPARLSDVVEKEKFDIVTVQQVSHLSGLYASYHPYADEFVAYIRKFQPDAKLWLHKTWAYEKDSGHSGFAGYCKNQKVMYEAICNVCEKIAGEINADGVIPSGDVVQTLRSKPEFDYPQEPSLCRDGFHMHLLYGRYAVAATWFETLLKGDIRKINFLPPVEIVGELHEGALKRIEIIKETVHGICSK